jgi:hypothetical protein
MIQEAIRILKNTSMDIPWERVAEMLSDLCLRMKESGYPEKYRENVILSALSAWEKMDRTGTRPMHRENGWKKEERIPRKERKKTGWLRGEQN